MKKFNDRNFEIKKNLCFLTGIKKKYTEQESKSGKENTESRFVRKLFVYKKKNFKPNSGSNVLCDDDSCAFVDQEYSRYDFDRKKIEKKTRIQNSFYSVEISVSFGESFLCFRKFLLAFKKCSKKKQNVLFGVSSHTHTTYKTSHYRQPTNFLMSKIKIENTEIIPMCQSNVFYREKKGNFFFGCYI